MDSAAAFCLTAAAGYLWLKRVDDQKKKNDTNEEVSSLFYVTEDNEPIEEENQVQTNRHVSHWHRATYILVMHDPPDMFYEPKEWSHTPVLLCQQTPTTKLKVIGSDEKKEEASDKEKSNDNATTEALHLPGGPLQRGETFINGGVRWLKTMTGVDVTRPENCLHHLFTFPYRDDETDKTEEQDGREDDRNDQKTTTKQWADFLECVHRGPLQELDQHQNLVRMSLQELHDKVAESSHAFAPETYYALRLYFQRQMDLRAQRRLLKGYSSLSLEHYKLRSTNSTNSLNNNIVFQMDEDDTQRTGALDYTLQTDDGMAPKLLLQADVVLLGVSRAGKTPLSLLLSQTKGIKVANIPLVLEVAPPRQLTAVDARRVFMITQSPAHLRVVRRERLRRELKHIRNSSPRRSTYADPDYIQRDLDHALELARTHGYTIVDLTDRAMEEGASLIMSKLKERFPDQDLGMG